MLGKLRRLRDVRLKIVLGIEGAKRFSEFDIKYPPQAGMASLRSGRQIWMLSCNLSVRRIEARVVPSRIR